MNANVINMKHALYLLTQGSRHIINGPKYEGLQLVCNLYYMTRVIILNIRGAGQYQIMRVGRYGINHIFI